MFTFLCQHFLISFYYIKFANRALWLVLILACLVYFTIATKTFMADYIQKTVSTKVKISQKKELPVSTFYTYMYIISYYNIIAMSSKS